MLPRLRAAAETLLSPPVLEFWAGALNKSWSFDRPLARVVARSEASTNAVTLVLKPNRQFRGFEPGQHVNVTVEVDGRRLTRSYSPSRSAHRGCLEITVKHVPGGTVSTHLFEKLAIGDVVELGPAYGDLRVPQPGISPRLLLAAGSGITPLLAIVRELAARGMPVPVTLYYWCRTRGEICFASELREIARSFENFKVRFVLTREAALHADELEGRIDELKPAAHLAGHIYACGTAGFVETARAMYDGKARSFTGESFSPPQFDAADTGTVRVTLARSGRTLEIARGTPLLAALEAQGVKPKYGCRMGICNTCACGKSAGATKNLVTGDIETEAASALRLCVNGASSDLVIDL